LMDMAACTDLLRHILCLSISLKASSSRSSVIEEVAVAIERMESFGKDTISSFAIYIRSMKE